MKFVNGFSASEASSHNTRNNSEIRVRFFSERSKLPKYKKHGGKGITFYTLDRLISEKAIFRGKVIQYNFLGSIITFLGIMNRRKTVKFVYYFSASEASSQNA